MIAFLHVMTAISSGYQELQCYAVQVIELSYNISQLPCSYPGGGTE